MKEKIFLAAEWRWLAMANYEVDPAVLKPFVPAGTELDAFGGKVFVSLVGFRFLRTRVFGVVFPGHGDFDEVNLRFYVRRGERRGTVFIREIVPRLAISAVARWWYHEPYITCPMRHRVEPPGRAEYAWKYAGRWHSLAVETGGGEPQDIAPGSAEEFITEHFWGYNRQRDGGTMEYEVEHPRWRVWAARDHRFDGDAAALYGEAFAPFLSARAASAFLVEGSAVTVRRGRRLRWAEASRFISSVSRYHEQKHNV